MKKKGNLGLCVEEKDEEEEEEKEEERARLTKKNHPHTLKCSDRL